MSRASVMVVHFPARQRTLTVHHVHTWLCHLLRFASQINMTEVEVVHEVRQLLWKSEGARWTLWYDGFQRLTNGIEY